MSIGMSVSKSASMPICMSVRYEGEDVNRYSTSHHSKYVSILIRISVGKSVRMAISLSASKSVCISLSILVIITINKLVSISMCNVYVSYKNVN